MRYGEGHSASNGRERRSLTRYSGYVIRTAAGMVAARGVRGVALAAGGAALFAVGATAAGVAVAGAAGPAASGTVSACVNNRTRVVTVPSAGQSCPAGTTALLLQGPAWPPGLGIVDSGPRFHLSGPQALAFDGTHLWVANQAGNSVTELNASDGSFVQNLSGGSYNFQTPVALLSDGTHIWVANIGGASVTEFNASDGSFVRNLSGGATPSTRPLAWPSTARTSGSPTRAVAPTR
jgi:hypothetical protein